MRRAAGGVRRTSTRRRCRRNARAHSWHPSAAPPRARGFRLRMADFEPEESRAKSHAGLNSACVVGVQDVAPPPIALETARARARAIGDAGRRSGGRHRDARSGALRGGGHPGDQQSADGGGAQILRVGEDASALTKPPFGDDPPGLKTRPQWLLGEYTFLRFLRARRRRRTTAAGRDRGPPRTRRTRGCWRVRRLTMHKYASVRAHARAGGAEGEAVPGGHRRSGRAGARGARGGARGRGSCAAACALLKCAPSVNRMRSDAAHFRATTQALLRSSHHDAEKAQTAVNEVFLSMAIRFSRVCPRPISAPAPSARTPRPAAATWTRRATRCTR